MNKLLCLAVALVASLTVSAQQLPDVKVENESGKMIYALEEWREEADFEVVAVSVDDVRLKARAKAKAASMGWDFICLFDANQAMKRAMNVSLTPQTFVVDAEGNIVFSHSGYTPGSEQLLFEKLLETIKK